MPQPIKGGRRDGETDPHGRRGNPPASAATIGEKHPGLRESVGLRGKASERRPRPARDAERGPSPPGKLGAMDRGRRGGSSPGSRGSGLVTKGCSAAFEGGELAKRPKGCEPFASGQPARGCTSALSRETGAGRPAANPPRVVPLTARRARRVHSGKLEWANGAQTPGDRRPRERTAVSGRTRRRSRGSARTQLSRCRCRQAARPTEALPPNASSRKRGRRSR
jgi:hypothetical protein